MFAEMPLDNRTVDKFAARFALAGIWPPPQGFLTRLESSPPIKRPNVSPRLTVL
jgi:hypothetical protein